MEWIVTSSHFSTRGPTNVKEAMKFDIFNGGLPVDGSCDRFE